MPQETKMQMLLLLDFMVFSIVVGLFRQNDFVYGLFVAYQLLRQYATSTFSCNNIKHINITTTGNTRSIIYENKHPWKFKDVFKRNKLLTFKAFVMLLSFIVHTII